MHQFSVFSHHWRHRSASVSTSGSHQQRPGCSVSHSRQVSEGIASCSLTGSLEVLWELVNKQPAGVSAWELPGNIGHFFWQWRCGHFHSVGGANAATGIKTSHSHSCRSLEGTRTPDRQPPQETENQVGRANTVPPTLHAWNSASSWCFLEV